LSWRGLGCRDGGRVDVRADAAGVPNLIEVNPLAGLNPAHSDLPILCRLAGIPYQDLIAMIMTSARERTSPARTAPQRRRQQETEAAVIRAYLASEGSLL
jgi:D-alanine-D-alanine ligase